MNEVNVGPFSSLIKWLGEIDFVVSGESTEDERFGNSVLYLRRGNTQIRVVRDRSQWFIEIAAPTSNVWFSPVVWLAALDGTMPPSRTFSNEEQAQIVRNRLEAIDSLAFDSPTDTLNLLTSWQRKRAMIRREQSLGES